MAWTSSCSARRGRASRCAKYLTVAVESALHAPAARVLIADDCGGAETLEIARPRLFEIPVAREPEAVVLDPNTRVLADFSRWESRDRR